MARQLWRKLRYALGLRSSIDAGLVQEIEFHIETPARIGEDAREEWQFGWLERLMFDVRYSLRTLRTSPSFTMIAILSLALGIGANTAIFSIVNGVLLRPLDLPEPERLVEIREVVPEVAQTYPTWPASARHFMEWTGQCSSLERLSLYDPGRLSLTGAGEPEQLDSMRVSANVFSTLGVQPALGRGFVEGEDQEGRDRVAILSDSLWRRRFHADPALVGKTITLDGQAHTVVGILARSFRFPAASIIDGQTAVPQAQVFKPVSFGKDELQQLMGMFNYGVIGRLRKGATREQAMSELNVIGARIVKLSGETLKLRSLVMPLQDSLTGKSRRGLLVLLGAVASMLLIVCVNLANLMLARAERYTRDAAVKTALGASRTQLLRAALTEALLIAFAGGLLGVTVAYAGLGVLVKSAPANIARLDEVGLDGGVLLFALAITTATGLLFGLAPAWRTARADPEAALKPGGRAMTGGAAGRRLRSALVSAEVGLSAVLLIMAGLLSSSFLRLMRADKGFQAPTVLATEISIPWSKYTKPEQRNAFHQTVIERLAASPGVLSASVSTLLPLQGEIWVDSAWLPGDARTEWERPQTNVRYVSCDYLRTMGIPLIAGRPFAEGDRARKVAVISQRLSQALWHGQEPIGRKFFSGGGDQPYEVIGVAGDVRSDVDRPPVPIMYRPYWQWAPSRVTVVARAAGDPWSVAGALRAVIHGVDGDVPIPAMRTMQEVLDHSVDERRFQMLLASAFALTALLLASFGIYGVVSFSVARRTNEMGLRIALGAQPGGLQWLVIRQSMAPVVLGLAGGVVAALAASGVLGSLLYEVSARDPLTIAGVAGVLLVLALASCYLPARHATRADPLAALRCD